MINLGVPSHNHDTNPLSGVDGSQIYDPNLKAAIFLDLFSNDEPDSENLLTPSMPHLPCLKPKELFPTSKAVPLASTTFIT